MPIKVLLVNFPREEIYQTPVNVEIASNEILGVTRSTIHDYHVIILDVNEINKTWGFVRGKDAQVQELFHDYLKGLAAQLREQIETGGVAFCFAGPLNDLRGQPYSDTNYDWCPIDLGIVSASGDTFYPKSEELRYYNALLKNVPDKGIIWSCYFSKLPENSRVIATNRAGYPVFAEIPIGQGKLVMLPTFKDRLQAVTTVVNELVPQMVHEEEPFPAPDWLPNFSSEIEAKTRTLLKEIDTAKKLLYAKDKVLKKAVAYAFQKLGFSVNILPDGTLPDLEVSADEMKGVIEVKGHDNKQVDRKDVLQLLGYLSETDAKVKGMFVSNHELRIPPDSRSPQAFTEGAIQLGNRNELCLLSSIELWKAVSLVLENKASSETLTRIRKSLMTGTGPVKIFSAK